MVLIFEARPPLFHFFHYHKKVIFVKFGFNNLDIFLVTVNFNRNIYQEFRFNAIKTYPSLYRLFLRIEYWYMYIICIYTGTHGIVEKH